MIDTKKIPYEPIPEPSSPAEMMSMTHDEATRILAQRSEDGSRTALIDSLCAMGRFDEALAIATNPEKQAWIQKLIDAEAAPDDERCKCRHTIDTADYTRNSEAIPVLVPAPNYITGFRHWSSRYGKMIDSRFCFLCGHVQAIPGSMDEMHEANSSLQRHALDAEIRKGTPIRTYPKHTR